MSVELDINQHITQVKQEHKEKTLGEHVTYVLKNYFNNLDGQHTTNLYDMVMHEVEKPLIETVLRFTDNNQTIAAKILGLNRGTLRKKMQQYNLLSLEEH